MRKDSIGVFQVYNRVDPPRIVLIRDFIQQKRYNICIQEVKQTISKGHIRLKNFTNIEMRHLPKVARLAAGKFLENLWSFGRAMLSFCDIRLLTEVLKATFSPVRFLLQSILQSSILLLFVNIIPYLNPTLFPLAA